MGRPRKPTVLLERSGAFKHNPSRRRPPEPRASGALGNPPVYLDEYEAGIWRELAGKAPVGLLTNWDEAAFGRFCMLEAKSRKREEMTGAETGLHGRLYTEFGMTGGSRSKISVPASKPQNKYAALGQRPQ